MTRNNDEAPLTQEDVEKRAATFQVVEPLIEAMYFEISAMSAKKPDTPINANKTKVANRLFADALSILEGEPSRQYLELIEPDDMPQNSDMVLSLKQFLTALEGFKRKYYQDYEWSALSDDDEEEEDS